MRKIVFFTALLLILAGLTPVVAQQNTASSSGTEGSYAITVTLERVYPYRKGYVVKYNRGLGLTSDIYLPNEWFEGTGKKGDLILMGSGADWPHMTVFYKDGQFSHVRLYVRKERGHESWGSVPFNVNIDDRFEGVEEIKLQF
ncbi:MAG: hypothetical protein LBK63_02615 [Treponema sp.]|nr:hypothetical protein [Treponema sp.]